MLAETVKRKKLSRSTSMARLSRGNCRNLIDEFLRKLMQDPFFF
jgi:hypothetical protein